MRQTAIVTVVKRLATTVSVARYAVLESYASESLYFRLTCAESVLVSGSGLHEGSDVAL